MRRMSKTSFHLKMTGKKVFSSYFCPLRSLCKFHVHLKEPARKKVYKKWKMKYWSFDSCVSLSLLRATAEVACSSGLFSFLRLAQFGLHCGKRRDFLFFSIQSKEGGKNLLSYNLVRRNDKKVYRGLLLPSTRFFSFRVKTFFLPSTILFSFSMTEWTTKQQPAINLFVSRWIGAVE